MQHHFNPLATILAATLQLAAVAAVPLAWDVRPGQPAPVTFDRYHGETLEFRCTFRGFSPDGQTVFGQNEDIRLWYQTNGMGSAWWSAPATIQSNVLSATWAPALDPGADRVSLFFGAPSNAYASAVLRLRHSPGFAPGAMPDPETFHESDPVFSSWLATNTPPETSLEPSTNYTDRVLGAFATTGTVRHAKSANNAATADFATQADVANYAYNLYNPQDWTSWTVVMLLKAATNYTDEAIANIDIPAEADPTVPEWAKEPNPPSYSAADVGAAPASIVPVLTSVSNDAATAKQNSETALRIVLGESVWFAVTNYMRTAEGVIPSLQLWEVRDGVTNLVYDSREEITNTVRALTTELRTELESRIPSKAWGNYQSDGTDNPQPGEVAIVNQPTVILTGGGTFNKYVEVGDSSVWVLQSSGPVSFGGNTNGNFFAVLDDEGNAHFRVAKTDSYDLPAFISDILTRQSQNHILIYTATTNRHGNAVSEHPTLSVCSDLKDSLWYEEVDGEIDALGISVSWTKDDTIPAWVATVTPDTYPPRLFFRCKVKQEGGVAVINTAPTRFDGGIQLGNGTYRLVPYTTGGKTYLTVEGLP